MLKIVLTIENSLMLCFFNFIPEELKISLSSPHATRETWIAHQNKGWDCFCGWQFVAFVSPLQVTKRDEHKDHWSLLGHCLLSLELKYTTLIKLKDNTIYLFSLSIGGIDRKTLWIDFNYCTKTVTYYSLNMRSLPFLNIFKHKDSKTKL